MTREEFIKKLHQLLPAPDDKITLSWIDWTIDIGCKEDIESYLHDLYTAFLGVRDKHGVELVNLIYTNMPYYALIYPNEIMTAADLLGKGCTLEYIGQMIEDDKLTSDTIASTGHNKCDKEAANHEPELSFGG